MPSSSLSSIVNGSSSYDGSAGVIDFWQAVAPPLTTAASFPESAVQLEATPNQRLDSDVDNDSQAVNDGDPRSTSHRSRDLEKNSEENSDVEVIILDNEDWELSCSHDVPQTSTRSAAAGERPEANGPPSAAANGGTSVLEDVLPQCSSDSKTAATDPQKPIEVIDISGSDDDDFSFSVQVSPPRNNSVSRGTSKRSLFPAVPDFNAYKRRMEHSGRHGLYSEHVYMVPSPTEEATTSLYYRQADWENLNALGESVWQNHEINSGHSWSFNGDVEQHRRNNKDELALVDGVAALHSALTHCPGPQDETEDPPELIAPLLIHQRQALTWLVWREDQTPSGGVLADDMGLGKTLTMIALILHQMAKEAKKKETSVDEAAPIGTTTDASQPTPGSNSTLIICPPNVVHQWPSEIQKFTGPNKLKMCVYHGGNRARLQERLHLYDVVVTTYQTLMVELYPRKAEAAKTALSDADVCDDSDSETEYEDLSLRGRSVLTAFKWRRIILDEAHSIKNRKTTTAKACRAIRASSRWALTGTPIQNDLRDLYSLIKFLRYEPFCRLNIWKKLLETKSRESEWRLRTLVDSFILRRMKFEVCCKTGNPLLDLPTKQSEEINLTLTADEQIVYDKMYAASRLYVRQYVMQKAALAALIDPVITPSTTTSVNDQSSDICHQSPFVSSWLPDPARVKSLNVLVILLRLRQACVHFALTNEEIDVSVLRQDSVVDDGSNVNGGNLKDVLGQLSGGTDLQGAQSFGRLFKESFLSTKLEALLLRIRAIRETKDSNPPQKVRTHRINAFKVMNQQHQHGSYTVIVSQWVKLLKIIGCHLEQQGFTYTTITGEVSAEDRQIRVESFNKVGQEPLIMLLSLTAGGVGLNLVGGNHMFILDLHWNPALEMQASDRIYRVGQNREVFIHKFVCQNTIETRVLELQKHKLRLVDGVFNGSNQKVSSKLSRQDLAFLFSLKTEEFF